MLGRLRGMEHLILPIRDLSYADALEMLGQALAFVVQRAQAVSVELASSRARWGIQAKREIVDLKGTSRPKLIGKNSERLIEAINMAATLERTIDALTWFSKHSAFGTCVLLECHPSTSSTHTGNDLVLGDASGNVRARCEVTDVASHSAGQNRKEKRDLKNLGCDVTFPDDGVRRFVCTSAEFASALASPKRKWTNYHYRYRTHEARIDDTAVLEVVAPAP